MVDKGYNGWSNYETWNVKLWIDNDEGSYEMWRERTRECWEANDHDKEDAISELARCLKEDHEENIPEVSGTYADLLGAALSEVNWYEIAEAMVGDEDFEEDAAEEEETETQS
jgi:hypothetical protein